MNPIVSAVKSCLRTAAVVHAKGKLGQLQDNQVPASGKIAGAVGDMLHNRLTADEAEWVTKIEAVRAKMATSTDTIELVDYGAGGQGDTRSQEEMYAGRLFTAKVAKSCQASKPHFWALLLFKLVREFKPTTCVELGTCLGISTAYQASALKLNGSGSIISMEGAPAQAELARANLNGLGLDNTSVVTGRFQDNLETVLAENKPIDYAFIDGHHDEHATIAYFEQFLPALAPAAVLVFDDISWTKGMRRAWDKILTDSRVKIAVDLRTIGICVLDDEITGNHRFRIPLI